MKFEPMRKIKRDPLSMVITEKMDGTNSSIHIFEELPDGLEDQVTATVKYEDGRLYYFVCASRNRWIAPNETHGSGSDNFGFAHFVKKNAEVLGECLGVGSHFGEWCGPGIQKNPHELDRKMFFLFNTGRWYMPYIHSPEWPHGILEVVPFLYKGSYSEDEIEGQMMSLKGDDDAYHEGVMVYCPEADHYRKVTFENSKGKWCNE